LANTLHTMADVLTSMKSYDAALDCYQRALEQYTILRGDKHIENMEVLIGKAGIYKLQSKWKETIETLNMIYEVFTKEYGLQHERVKEVAKAIQTVKHDMEIRGIVLHDEDDNNNNNKQMMVPTVIATPTHKGSLSNHHNNNSNNNHIKPSSSFSMTNPVASSPTTSDTNNHSPFLVRNVLWQSTSTSNTKNNNNNNSNTNLLDDSSSRNRELDQVMNIPYISFQDNQNKH
jgi:tetratricopeptide (TPR) repeat protein